MWTYNNDELYHFGILGMKWGVRKANMYTNAYNRANNASNYYGRLASNAAKTKKPYSFQVTGNLVSSRQNAFLAKFYKKHLDKTIKNLKTAKGYNYAYNVTNGKYFVEKNSNLRSKKIASNSKVTSSHKKNLTDRFYEAKKKDPSLTYAKIYNSKPAKKVTAQWKKDFSQFKDDPDAYKEDSSYYKEMEDAYYKSKNI